MNQPHDRGVLIDVRIPWDLADVACQIQAKDPEYFRRVILQAVTRHGIYEEIRERGAAAQERGQ